MAQEKKDLPEILLGNTVWRQNEGESVMWITGLVKCHNRIYGSIILNPWILSKNNEALAFLNVLLPPSPQKNKCCHQELITCKTMVCKKIY